MTNSTNKSKLFVSGGETGEEMLDGQVVAKQTSEKVGINDLKMRLLKKIKIELDTT